ncbi:hypothetical protein EMIHUDRAFT_239467 [Emiliania huxleyi CCMP1516]|uniref:Uncharacterized protein n=2 Tax=Emiliania huxleyi TaxID=2903 RepID=A0A0D3JJ79_EMIH1|nr:hypothetical protein EMIHUDRAFT_239467 [Emiliania huxleyi CCMP1516]EOD23564.1 hypothetical protein EMIHUDRAFT_239467 [Emiliania huxleyi CCMP1516]|eukprot:XP_005775993.1 hypothetical protein EMIHUDRAFT_239467 [Emiliania huxleyi CCMP1516]
MTAMPAEPAAAHAAEKPPLTSDYLDCAQLRFSLGCTTVADKAPLKAQADAALLAKLEAANATELARLSDAIKTAEESGGSAGCVERRFESEGESEICSAMLAKAELLAEFLMRIGERAKALAALEETYAKTVGSRSSGRSAMLALFFDDKKLTADTIDAAKGLLDQGGDWERRSRLEAADLLLDSVATFTATELISYNTFVLYTVTTSLLSLPRADLKSKVIDAPEILQVLGEIPHLANLLNGLYECRYRSLMEALLGMLEWVVVIAAEALVGIVDSLYADRYMHAHTRFYWRELRVPACSPGMATSFGVSADFLDKELSGFIAAERLSCKIDKARRGRQAGGDLLLNRLQKLSRVINV